jgi:hypothetical protein
MNAKAVSVSPAWSFVRLTAWSMIILGVLCAGMSVVLGFLALILTNPDVIADLREAPELAGMSGGFWFALEHMLALAAIALWMSVLTVLAGWGLLRRQLWSLWFSIAMFWLGSLSNLIGIWLHVLFLNHFREFVQGVPEWTIQMIEANYWSAQISGAVFGLVFAAGFGWTAWKLGSAPVRAEFVRP